MPETVLANILRLCFVKCGISSRRSKKGVACRVLAIKVDSRQPPSIKWSYSDENEYKADEVYSTDERKSEEECDGIKFYSSGKKK